MFSTVYSVGEQLFLLASRLCEEQELFEWNQIIDLLFFFQDFIT